MGSIPQSQGVIEVKSDQIFCVWVPLKCRLKSLSCCISWPYSVSLVLVVWGILLCKCFHGNCRLTEKVLWNMNRLTPPLPAPPPPLLSRMHTGEERSNTARNWNQSLPQPRVLRKVSCHWNQEYAKFLTFTWRIEVAFI